MQRGLCRLAWLYHEAVLLDHFDAVARAWRRGGRRAFAVSSIRAANCFHVRRTLCRALRGRQSIDPLLILNVPYSSLSIFTAISMSLLTIERGLLTFIASWWVAMGRSSNAVDLRVSHIDHPSCRRWPWHFQFGTRRFIEVVRPERLVSGHGHCPLVPVGDRSWHGLMAR